MDRKFRGESGVSAITNCYPLTLLIIAISTGISLGTSVLVSQYYGAKEEEKLKSIVGVSYLLTIIISITTVLVMIITSNLWFKLLNTPEEILHITKQYLIIYSIGFIFNFLLTVIMESLRAIGNSKIPLVFVVISTVVNIVLDPILIKLGLGVAGAAIATLIAMFTGTMVSIIYVNTKSKLLKIDFKYLKLNKEYVNELLKIGIPIVIEEWIISAIILLEVNVSNETGVLGSASYGVVSKLEQVIMVIAGSLKTMASVTVGQYIGNGKIKESKNVLKQGLKLCIIPIILIMLVVFVFPRNFCQIFVYSEDVIQMSMLYLSVVGLSYILLPVRQLVHGFIVGTGHTKYVLFSAILASVIEVIIILGLRRTSLNNLVVLGIGILLWVLTEMILNIIYYFSNKWQEEVIEK